MSWAIFSFLCISVFFVLAIWAIILDISYFNEQIRLIDDFKINFFEEADVEDLKNKGLSKSYLESKMGRLEEDDAVYNCIMTIKILLERGGVITTSDIVEHSLGITQTRILSQAHHFSISTLLIIGILGSISSLPDVTKGLTHVWNDEKNLSVDIYRKSVSEIPEKLEKALLPAFAAIACMILILILRFFLWQSSREKVVHKLVKFSNLTVIPFFMNLYKEQNLPMNALIEILRKTTIDLSNNINSSSINLGKTIDNVGNTLEESVSDFKKASEEFIEQINPDAPFFKATNQIKEAIEYSQETQQNLENRYNEITKINDAFSNQIDEIKSIGETFQEQSKSTKEAIQKMIEVSENLSDYTTDLSQSIYVFSELINSESPIILRLKSISNSIENLHQEIVGRNENLQGIIDFLKEQQQKDSSFQSEFELLVKNTTNAITSIAGATSSVLEENALLYNNLQDVIGQKLPSSLSPFIESIAAELNALNISLQSWDSNAENMFDRVETKLSPFISSIDEHSMELKNLIPLLNNLGDGIPVNSTIIVNDSLEKTISDYKQKMDVLNGAIIKLDGDVEQLRDLIRNSLKRRSIFWFK